jgi:SIR2-like domain
MAGSLDETKWKILLTRIKNGECLPFIGAGASASVLPSGATIAQEWATEFGYPLEDSGDLARVAQFLTVSSGDKVFPKDLIKQRFAGVGPPDFTAADDPHGVLATLPLPIYLTTNYDNFMTQALRRQGKEVRQELCVWNSLIGQPATPAEIAPTAEKPIVYHLHGHLGDTNSLVLTEDDYLDFMIKIAKDDLLIPPRIEAALTGTSILFIGYRIVDWNFRVIFRSLVTYLERSLKRSHISVQLEPKNPQSEERKRQSLAYLEKYYLESGITVYWGTAQEFVNELRQRWEALSRGG